MDDIESFVIPPGPQGRPTSLPPGVEGLIRTLHEHIRSVIEKHRQQKYTSHSNVEETATGNRYQSLELADEVLGGFRGPREGLFAQIKFTGSTVLDIGCNTGELSRLARRHGAVLVDGFDYDPYFVCVGRLVNAYNAVTRVSLYSADATSPQTYKGTYDIVLAFSVFPYIQKALPAVAAATGKIFILETHKLTKESAEASYINTLKPYFPVCRVLGATDWGIQFYGQGYRTVLAFSRDEATLEQMLTPIDSHNLLSIDRRAGVLDLRRSYLGFLTRFETEFGLVVRKGIDKLLETVAKVDVSDYPRTDFLAAVSGASYWAAFLQGYGEYLEEMAVSPTNTYAQHILRLFCERPFDPGLQSIIKDPERLAHRILLRYRTLDKMRANDTADVPSVSLINIDVTRDQFRLFDKNSGQWLSCQRFDGYHRLFAARISGCAELPFVCRTDEEAPTTAAADKIHCDS